jgi:hypothetical protein
LQISNYANLKSLIIKTVVGFTYRFIVPTISFCVLCSGSQVNIFFDKGGIFYLNINGEAEKIKISGFVILVYKTILETYINEEMDISFNTRVQWFEANMKEINIYKNFFDLS